MKFICATMLFLFSVSAWSAGADWKKNRECIRVLNKFELLPENYELVAVKNGGIIVVSSGANDTVSIWNGKPEAESNGMYPSHTLNPNGSCTSQRQSSNGVDYFSGALSSLLASPVAAHKTKAKELIEACKDAPVFKEATATTQGYYRAAPTATSKGPTLN